MTAASDRYIAIVVCREIDRFSHNDLFANELAASFADYGIGSKIIDYRAQPTSTFAAMRDPKCIAFLTFNGFGTELKSGTLFPARLESAFEMHGKPVVDLMHDCPAHESMAHQLDSTFSQRQLLATDYEYAELAADFGVRNVLFAPSIVFPKANERRGQAVAGSRIQVLLAIGTSPPELHRARLSVETLKGRLFGNIFDRVVETAVADWRINPLRELKLAFGELGSALDVTDVDHRFLLTVVLDYVKFSRRQSVLATLAGLPVTLVPDRPGDYPGFNVLNARSASELLALMGHSDIVVCPVTHINGFHERPLSALTAGAAVVSGPNSVLLANFRDGEEMVFFRSPADLRASVEKLVSDEDLRTSIASAGHQKAMAEFSPGRLVSTVLNVLRYSA